MKLRLTAVLNVALLLAVLWTPVPVGACEEGVVYSAGDSPQFVDISIGHDAPVIYLAIEPDHIRVYTVGQLQPLQQITYGIADANVPELTPGERIELVDMNFDGYIDLKIMSAWGNVNVYYDCWLWDQQLERFIFHEKLSSLSGVSFNPAQQSVSFFSRDSSLDYTEGVYLWQDDILQPLKIVKRSYNWEQGVVMQTVYESNEGGDLRLVSTEIMPENF